MQHRALHRDPTWVYPDVDPEWVKTIIREFNIHSVTAHILAARGFYSLEEIHENKEQIEISKAYEKMPTPSLLAIQESLEDKIYYRKNTGNDLFK